MNKPKNENISVTLPPDVLRLFEKKAKEEMRSLSSLCRYALVKYSNENLKNQEKKDGC